MIDLTDCISASILDMSVHSGRILFVLSVNLSLDFIGFAFITFSDFCSYLNIIKQDSDHNQENTIFQSVQYSFNVVRLLS